MLRFAFKNMAVRRAKLFLTALSVVIASSVGLLAFNISMQVSEGIINTAGSYDIIIGPAGSSTQLAMNTMFFTDKPLGAIPYSIVDELSASGKVNAVVPFSMGDSYNSAPIVGATAQLLDGKALAQGEMFSEACEVVAGYDVARQYGLSVGDQILSSHGLTGTGHEHEASPLTVTGVLARTDTAYDNAIFTHYTTIWALHGEEDAHDAEEEGESGETEAHSGDICAVLVRSKSVADYSALMAYYGSNSDYLAINPATVLREVLDNVDLNRKIVYALCAVILVMNVFVVAVIALLNMYDARRDIALMRLIGIGMGKINLLFLIQNAIVGVAAMLSALGVSHLFLLLIRNYVASMGIVLNALRVYPEEAAIALAAFVLTVLPTAVLTLRMARQDGARV